MLVMIAAGLTEAERDKVFLGRGDSPFVPEAIVDIKDAAETLAPYRFDQVYSSDLYRAQETLRGILKGNPYNPGWELVEELRERSAGSYEGMKYSDIRKGMSPKQYKVWERDPFEAPLHGESLMDIHERLSPWFQDQIAPRLEKNENILVISHPDTIRVLIAMARGDDLIDVTSIQIEHTLPYFYHGSTRKETT